MPAKIHLILRALTVLLLMAGCRNRLPEEITVAYQNLPDRIDFNFHIRPLLSDRCYACHGPDQNQRKA